MLQPPPATPKPNLVERAKSLFAQYGALAITIYFVIFGLVLAGFAFAIHAGVQVDGATEGAGTLLAAWFATKLTQPLRILATLALTPLVARLRDRLRAPKTPDIT